MLWYDLQLFTTPEGTTSFRNEIATDGDGSVTFTGLTPSTTYYIQAIPRTSNNEDVTTCGRVTATTTA